MKGSPAQANGVPAVQAPLSAGQPQPWKNLPQGLRPLSQMAPTLPVTGSTMPVI